MWVHLETKQDVGGSVGERTRPKFRAAEARKGLDDPANGLENVGVLCESAGSEEAD